MEHVRQPTTSTLKLNRVFFFCSRPVTSHWLPLSSLATPVNWSLGPSTKEVCGQPCSNPRFHKHVVDFEEGRSCVTLKISKPQNLKPRFGVVQVSVLIVGRHGGLEWAHPPPSKEPRNPEFTSLAKVGRGRQLTKYDLLVGHVRVRLRCRFSNSNFSTIINSRPFRAVFMKPVCCWFTKGHRWCPQQALLAAVAVSSPRFLVCLEKILSWCPTNPLGLLVPRNLHWSVTSMCIDSCETGCPASRHG